MQDQPRRVELEKVVWAYAWALLAAHLVVWLFFADTRILYSVTEAREPFCWPYFEDCWKWRIPSEGHANFLQVGYLLLCALAFIALWHRRWNAYWWALLGVNLFLFGLVSLDYRLRANEFYMLFWINGVFLMTRTRRWTIPAAITSCYFWAGILKLNLEWLSGAVLYSDLWLIPKWLTPAACVYVAILEVLLIWGLFARRQKILALTLAQLGLFHLQSLSQIHWFYPLLMATILSWFLLDRWLSTDEGRANLKTLVRGSAPLATYAVIGVFGTLQVIPQFFRGDSTLTGQGRTFALHMFEARQQCVVTGTAGTRDQAPITLDLKLNNLAPRMICDPVVYFNRAQNLCRKGRLSEPSFDLHLVMRSKRATDAEYVTIIDEPSFCGGAHNYRLLRNNAWLR